jgi:predicted metal-dependent hydrolase
MPTIQIGRAEIAYELRRSATAAERRITVTPGHVEVMALTTDGDDDIAGFLERKRQWLFNTMRDMERISASRHAVPRFMTGSKIPYCGRKMPLTVRRTDAERFTVTYRNGFIVDLPEWAPEDAGNLVASEIKLWLKQKARRHVKLISDRLAANFGISPRSIRTADMVSGWGSCGPEGNILIDWHLIFAPSKVLEYVVTHEVSHLRERSHGPEFWDLVQTMMPQFEDAKAWLERHGSSLGSDFLSV